MAGNTKNQQKYFLQIYWIINYDGLDFSNAINTFMLNNAHQKNYNNPSGISVFLLLLFFCRACKKKSSAAQIYLCR